MVGGGGGGRAALTAANCHCSFKAQGRLGVGGSFSQAQSLEGGSGQEAGRQGYSFATGRTWGPLKGGLESAQRGQEPSSVYALTGWLSIMRVIFGACSGHGLQTHTAFSAPSRPSALRRLQQGLSEDTGSQRESVCGTDRKGAEWRDGPNRGWASVVLKEGQKVIVTIARQVRGVQVREELVRICEFWKEIQRRLRHVGCSLCSGLTL